MWPKCDSCGRFARIEVGASFGTAPERELFKCRSCSDKHGPLVAREGFAQWTAGVYTEKHFKNPDRN